MPVPAWEQEANTIADRLSRPASLRLCVKTKDETDMLAGWIEHHAGIVGLENLIVADNCSTDPRTLEIYRSYGESLCVFGFPGEHNQIHWHPRFAPLFEAIRQSTRYFAFIDVDERLIHCDGTRWRADGSIVERIEGCDGIVPTTWLINEVNRHDRFTLLSTEGHDDLAPNLRWGKPLMPARLAGTQPGIHTSQLAPHHVTTMVGTTLFLLHLTQFPAQRIAVNLRKLASRGLIAGDERPEAILTMDFSGLEDVTPARFQEEIAAMLAILDDPARGEAHTGTLDLLPNGDVQFSDAATRDRFLEYLARGPALIEAMFNGGDGAAP